MRLVSEWINVLRGFKRNFPDDCLDSMPCPYERKAGFLSAKQPEKRRYMSLIRHCCSRRTIIFLSWKIYRESFLLTCIYIVSISLRRRIYDGRNFEGLPRGRDYR